MQHFLEITQLRSDEAIMLIQRALYFKAQKIYPVYSQHTVANLFYESSTRTRVSFELAATNLGMRVVNLAQQASSEQKGEAILDTIKTLSAMGIDLFVMRHGDDGLPSAMAVALGDAVHLVNAGDGVRAHPSQALLDMMTILEKKSDIKPLKIAIVGDIRHSRVANSLQCIGALLGVRELVLIAPEPWLPNTVHYGRTTTSLREGLVDADVVICLRVQRERLSRDEAVNMDDYRRDYAITSATMKYAKADAMVMHPGPMNRGVEIDSDVADGPQSFILEQVRNGVFMRMAILEALVDSIQT